MDSNFNPIKDLQPVDPFNLPAGESTKSIEAIRLRLVETRSRTAGIVDVLKKRNKDFSKDIKTIRELNRRLMRTIPRIPILRGDASVQGGSLEEISARRGEFDFDFNTTTVPPDLSDLTKPTANIRGRLINFAVDIILFFFGGRLLKGFLPGGLKNPKNIKRLNDLLKLPVDDLVDDTVKVNPFRKIKKIKVENPVKANKDELSKISKKFFNKNNTQKVTSQIRAEANKISNALASGDTKTVLEKAPKSIKLLEDMKADILEEFGKTINPTKLQTTNQNTLIQEIDKAILKIRNIQGLPQFKPTPLSKNEPLPKTLEEIIAESEDFDIFQFKPRPKKKFYNTQRDREINIYQKGKEYTEDVNQFIKLDGNSRVDPNLIEDLKRRSGIKKEIYIIDQ